jgi:hypothetical protein
MDETRLPTDPFSQALRRLRDNPAAVEKESLIDLQNFYGQAETWVVRTIRVEGADVIFLQHVDANGGHQWVLPPEVTAAIARQREGIASKIRTRGARKAAATRAANGMRPAFLKAEKSS